MSSCNSSLSLSLINGYIYKLCLLLLKHQKFITTFVISEYVISCQRLLALFSLHCCNFLSYSGLQLAQIAATTRQLKISQSTDTFSTPQQCQNHDSFSTISYETPLPKTAIYCFSISKDRSHRRSIRLQGLHTTYTFSRKQPCFKTLIDIQKVITFFFHKIQGGCTVIQPI